MEMVAKFGGVCVGPRARVCSGSLLGAQCPPGVVMGAEERNEEAVTSGVICGRWLAEMEG